MEKRGWGKGGEKLNNTDGGRSEKQEKTEIEGERNKFRIVYFNVLIKSR